MMTLELVKRRIMIVKRARFYTRACGRLGRQNFGQPRIIAHVWIRVNSLVAMKNTVKIKLFEF